MAEYKEVVHERLYVRVPGADKLRKTSAGRLKYLLAAGWRETQRWDRPEFVTGRLERSGHAPTMKILPKPTPPPPRPPRQGGPRGFGGRGGGFGGRGGPGGPRGGPGGPTRGGPPGQPVQATPARPAPSNGPAGDQAQRAG